LLAVKRDNVVRWKDYRDKVRKVVNCVTCGEIDDNFLWRCGR